MMHEVRPERTGWRDEALSQRHRTWGWDCPAVDIDFLLLDFYNGKAVAMVEYKQWNARGVDTTHPSYRALIDLGDRADLPVFICRYTSDFSKWVVSSTNEAAIRLLPERTEMTEVQWVRFLYKIRGSAEPVDLLKQIAKKHLKKEVGNVA